MEVVAVAIMEAVTVVVVEAFRNNCHTSDRGLQEQMKYLLTRKSKYVMMNKVCVSTKPDGRNVQLALKMQLKTK